MVLISKNEAETLFFGEEMGKRAKYGDIYCVIGDLGAGKTVFSKGFARGLGVTGQVTSPTFTFVNEYEGRLPFYHFDAYRLDSIEQAVCFEFDEYFDAGVSVIEWADNVLEAIPERAVFIRIERVEGAESERRITLEETDK